MNKYVYSICTQDAWPSIETVMASGISDAEDRVISEYCEMLDIDINNMDYLQFQEIMNDHDIVISDVYDIEEL